MDIKKAGILFLRSVSAAMGFLFFGYLLLEWSMPGSVLPFIDVIDLLPYVCVLFFFAFLTIKRKSGVWNFLQILIGIILSAILLTVLWLRIDGYSLKNATLLASGIICILVWAFVSIKEPID